jgi:hypothetical protein
MNILQSIKNLYKGEDKIAIHTSVFALTGITAIAFVNIASIFLGHSIYSIFSVPKDAEAIIYSIIGITIFIFFTGYKFKYVNRLFADENSALPSVSLDCFTIFAKIFPIIFLWAIYTFIFYIIAGTILGVTVLKGILPTFLAILLFPFLNAIIVLFSENFEYKTCFTNPLLIFSIMKRTFVPIFSWIFQFLILFIIVSLFFKFMFQYTYSSHTKLFQLSLTLILTCISGYVQEIMNLAYLNGIVNILKEKYLKQS